MTNFDAMAAGFDTARRETRAAVIAGEMAARIARGKTGSALDYGCGTGLIGFRLCSLFDSFLFMDASMGMIAEVSRKISENRLADRASALCGGMDDLPAGRRFDCIVSSMALHHIPDTAAILRNFYERLNPNGSLLLVDLDPDNGAFHADEKDFTGHNGFDRITLAALCESLGYLNVKTGVVHTGVRPVNGIDVSYSLFLLEGNKALCREYDFFPG